MRNLEELSSAQVEESLIADADKADSWESPIKVPGSNSPRPEWYGQQTIEDAELPNQNAESDDSIE